MIYYHPENHNYQNVKNYDFLAQVKLMLYLCIKKIKGSLSPALPFRGGG